MNVELLKKIKIQILKEPLQFDMGKWFTLAPGIPNCGTAACIAGWAVALHEGITPEAARQSKHAHAAFFISGARKALDISTSMSDRIFFDGYWPEPFCARHQKARSPQERAQVAADYIDHLIAEYERTLV